VSFVTLTGLQYLQTQGFDAASTMQVQYTSASDSAGLTVLQGKADVAIMSLPNYNKLKDDVRATLHIVWQSDPQPSRIYLAKAGKNISVIDWQRALQAFSQSPEGETHLKESQLKGFRVFNPAELVPLRPLANATLQLLDH